MDFDMDIERRDFIRFISVLAVSFLMPNSSEAKEIQRMLENEDREGFYIRFYKPFKPVDPSKWTLRVGGLCSNPQSFNLASLKKLKKETQASRMKCVESWSSKAKWGGIRPKTLFDTVKLKKQAKFLYFYSADDYYEFISIEDLLKPRVLFVYEMNDGPLPDIHGGPLRLIIPFKYGYKSVKTIVRLDFVEKSGTGYWSKFGYDKDGNIKPGTDFPLDLKGYRDITKDGEPDY
ncbi:MAG: molybdopterin-dependent oxidoreductase, partial [Proteobacteria bacterium]|nr:molybdopterin-dependent oxidoreductase [Pseudomonadota bacterium]